MKTTPQIHLANSGSVGTGLLIALAAAAPPVEKPQAQKRTSPPNTPQAKINKFKQFDLDGDGICPREEYERAHRQNFDQCDKNKDGLLERTEFPWGAIVRHDTNKDAKLDRDEYKARYDELFLFEDKNKDGVLFVEEM